MTNNKLFINIEQSATPKRKDCGRALNRFLTNAKLPTRWVVNVLKDMIQVPIILIYNHTRTMCNSTAY